MKPINIITKTGDNGTTGLNCGGRVSKADDRIYMVGKIDTFHAQLGICKVHLGGTDAMCLDSIIHTLFLIMGEIAIDPEKLDKTKKANDNSIVQLEALCKDISNYLEKNNYSINSWIIYGSGNIAAAHLDMASKLCREIELLLHRLDLNVRNQIKVFFNRLSDFLYLFARKSETKE